MTAEEFERTFAHVTSLNGSKAPTRVGAAR